MINSGETKSSCSLFDEGRLGSLGTIIPNKCYGHHALSDEGQDQSLAHGECPNPSGSVACQAAGSGRLATFFGTLAAWLARTILAYLAGLYRSRLGHRS